MPKSQKTAPDKEESLTARKKKPAKTDEPKLKKSAAKSEEKKSVKEKLKSETKEKETAKTHPPKKKAVKSRKTEGVETDAPLASDQLQTSPPHPAVTVKPEEHPVDLHKSVTIHPVAESSPAPKKIVRKHVKKIVKADIDKIPLDKKLAIPAKIAEEIPLPKSSVQTAVVSSPSVSLPEMKTAAVPQTSEAAPLSPAPVRSKILINETITVKELTEKMNLKIGDVLIRLLKMGIRASLNQRLDIDTAILISSELGFDAEFVPIFTEEAMLKVEKDDVGKMVPRSPIVTIMGHVDHGKTSLLDAVRETRVAEKEAGGITQHIGAYKVRMEKGSIVFLDTPGHEAFTAMRARGAQATDIVVLVVAADDGVMPQTIEAIDHARAAGVPILVAVNKIDLPQSKAERVKQELSKYDLSPEEWGGKTIYVEVSAKKKMNIDKLLEMILLEAELLELKANPNRPAQGVVIEAKLDAKKGPVVTVLVQKGTMRIGNIFVCGLTSGKVRALTDDRSHRILEAGPSTPVEVLGFSELPHTGERVMVVNSDRESKEIAERRKNLSREAITERKRHISLEILSAVAKQGKVKELNLILKADVQGSIEALRDSIEKISTPEIHVRVIHAGVGGITESDVHLATASDAVIFGFSVRPEQAAEDLARREGVEIKTYRIIYEAIADIRAAMEGLLEPEEKEVSTGRVEVREVYKTPAGKVAGCMVVQGKVSRGSKARVVRDSKIIFEGQIGSLRRFKEDVREVDQGYECGTALDNFQDYRKGDVLEIFIREKRSRKLE